MGLFAIRYTMSVIFLAGADLDLARGQRLAGILPQPGGLTRQAAVSWRSSAAVTFDQAVSGRKRSP